MKDRIKKIRRDAGMTQKDFATAVGVKPIIVSHWETGATSPGKARLYVIAERFKVNPQWLIDGMGDIYRSDALNDATQAQIEIDVIKSLFQGLPVEYQNKILVALREMIATGSTVPSLNSNRVDISGTVNGNVDITQGGSKDS